MPLTGLAESGVNVNGGDCFIMKLLLFCLGALACDFELHAQPGVTNLWAFLAALHPVTSPFTFCLAGGDDTHRFTLDDSASGCVWSSLELVIQ